MDKELLNAISDLLEQKLSPIKDDLRNIKDDVKDLKDDVNNLKIQQEESITILKALEHKADVNRAEHDKMANDIAKISGNIENMRKDLSTVEIVTARNMENIAQLKIVK